MSIRDYAVYAAKQYGVDPGIIDGIAKFESTYNPTAVNDWDSNAKRGTPSKGLMQFIQPTFNSYARSAMQANPAAWKNFNGKLDWMNPQQQMLATAWAVKNGHGKAWATYDRAKQYAANGYNYTPTNRYGLGATGTPAATGVAPAAQPAVNPQQVAAIKADYNNAIKLRQAQVKDAATRLGKFDALSDEDKRLLAWQPGASDAAASGSIGAIAAASSGPSQAFQEVLNLKGEAKQQHTTAKSQVTKLQRERDNIATSIAEAQLPPARSELGGAGNPDLRAKLVATARQEVGTLASGAMKYIKAAGGTGYEPWCGDFVQYVFKQNGLKPPPARSVPALLKWAEGNGTRRQTGRAGDLAMFDWNSDGVPDHVELVAGGKGKGQYQMIGGNTSGPQGSSQVAQKNRGANILGFVDALSLLGRPQ